MPTVLLTGFEPFAQAPVNPSWDAVQIVAECWTAPASLIVARLPVEFGAASAALIELVDLHRPDVVIATGVAEGRTAVSIETVAVNMRDARIPDNAGAQPQGEPVVPAAEQRVETSLPVDRIVDALTASGVPVETSDDAGRYVCNDTFYALRHATAPLGIAAGFIHVPASAAMRLDSTVTVMDPAVVAKGLRIAAEVSLAAIPAR